MLDLVFRNTTKNTKHGKVFFDDIISTAVKELKLMRPRIELSINLIGSARMSTLNYRYRSKNKPTDVLSFPLNETVSRIPSPESLNHAILPLGDIFICVPVAQKDARHEGIALANKLRFLTIHGLLHLLGYDHERSINDEKRMFRLQEKILDKITANR